MLPFALTLHVALGALLAQAPPPPPMLSDAPGDPAGGDEEAAAEPAAPDEVHNDDGRGDPADDPDAAAGDPDAPANAEQDELYNVPAAPGDQLRDSGDDAGLDAPPNEAPNARDDDDVTDKRERFKKQRRRHEGDDGVLPDDALDPLLVLALQVALGVLLSNATAILWPIAPVLVATAQVILGDLIGPNRGAVLPSAAAGYAGMLACGLTPPLVAAIAAGAAFAIVVFLPGMMAASGLVGALGLALLYPSLLLALPAAHCGNSVFSSLAYLAMSEPKQPGDTGFRYPGVFAPAHKPPDEGWETLDLPPRTDAVAMAF